jgi:hypothetical protein
MRCPKCGYITFDHLETCTKCRKNIAQVSMQLSGTVYKAETPSFLQFEVYESDTDNDASVDLLSEEEDIELDMSADGDDGVDMELSLEDDTLESDEAQADEDLDLDFMDESVEALGLGSSEGDEFDLDLANDGSIDLDLDEGGKDAAEGEDGPQLDFSELDISDLAPPSADEDDLSSGELTFEGVADASAATVADAALSSAKTTGAGLEDLQMDGLDLEIPSLPPAGSATGKKLRTSVKTGTALDKFDIDLGELISDQEK